jgi:trans-2,3-dihydro-3-hydroxyanthranilate isomerase
VVEVTGSGASWTLRTVQEPRVRAHEASAAECAAMLGVDERALGGEALWVDTGAEQLIVPLARARDVGRAEPSAALLVRHGFSPSRREAMVYVWAREKDEGLRTPKGSGVEHPQGVVARFFFVANGSVVEDPATGSACANLGGWMLATKAPLPVRLSVRQGDAVGRPSLLRLHVDAERRIFVQGDVIELGRGAIEL